jgi:hypothetical protein
MRAAHLQAIEKVELKNDPATFKCFAEKIMTHLFDLSWIVASSMPDLTEKISLKITTARSACVERRKTKRIGNKKFRRFRILALQQSSRLPEWIHYRC